MLIKVLMVILMKFKYDNHSLVLKETSNGFKICSMVRSSQNIDGGHQRASQKRKTENYVSLSVSVYELLCPGG